MQYVDQRQRRGPKLVRKKKHDLCLIGISLKANLVKPGSHEINGHLEVLGAAANNEPDIYVENDHQEANFLKRGALQ